MGREGVAYSFVTPEQGIELTRIEMLINTLLNRDEIEGFQTVAQAAPPQESGEEAKEDEPKSPLLPANGCGGVIAGGFNPRRPDRATRVPALPQTAG